MYWVDKYITEIEDQGCTRIACISKGLVDMHTLKEKPDHELTLWVVYYSLEEVDDLTPYGSSNKIPYSSIDWVDRDIIEIKTLGGKGFFYFCNNFVVVTGRVLECGQKKIFIFNPLDTSYTHAHEVHFYLHVFEEL